MHPSALLLELPDWLRDQPPPAPIPHLSERMDFVLGLAQRNVTAGTGGPFAAAVFVRDSGELVSVGVNRVVPSACSLAHAEVLALGLAHTALGTYDLGAAGRPALQLVSSSQMCAMCLGAVAWSGVAEVAFSTTTGDVVAALGFDEGPEPPDPVEQLRNRGISVLAGLMRDRGLAVLRAYAAAGGVVYNAHH